MPKKNETLEWWATDLLLEAHAITPCPDHGYMRLRHSSHSVNTPAILQSTVSFPAETRKSVWQRSRRCWTVSETPAPAVIETCRVS